MNEKFKSGPERKKIQWSEFMLYIHNVQIWTQIPHDSLNSEVGVSLNSRCGPKTSIQIKLQGKVQEKAYQILFCRQVDRFNIRVI